MARVVYGDGNNASALLFQPMVQELSSYISRANEYVYDRVSDLGRTFLNKATQFKERLGFRQLEDNRQQMRDNLDAIAENARYRYLSDAEAIVTAPEPMRIWLYANDTVARYAKDEKLHGWGDAPQFHNEAERQVYKEYILDGTVNEDGDYTHYFSPHHEFIDEQYELTDRQKRLIERSWNTIENCLLVEEIDPTDPYLSRV